MKTYTDFGTFICDGDPAAGGVQIPKKMGCPAYVGVMAAVGVGEAEVIARVRPPPTEADRSEAKRAVDDGAERCRLQWITGGAGQAMVYQEKRAEADRYVASGGAGSYPILSATVGIEAADLAGVAALVLATTTAWLTVAAAIETLRLSAKREIDAAEAWDQMAAAAVEWPEA